MTRAYSVDLRERVVQPVSGGGAVRAVAAMVAVSAARAWLAPFPTVTGRPPPLSPDLRQDGLTAPFVIDRPMNGAIFLAYIERCPAPTLSPGDIVVMDNLPAHKVAGVRQAIRAREAELLYLPPPVQARGRLYSPDLNPSEMLFAKLKALLRKAAERSIPALWTRIGELLDQFPRDECRHYLAHAGYV